MSLALFGVSESTQPSRAVALGSLEIADDSDKANVISFHPLAETGDHIIVSWVDGDTGECRYA